MTGRSVMLLVAALSAIVGAGLIWNARRTVTPPARMAQLMGGTMLAAFALILMLFSNTLVPIGP